MRTAKVKATFKGLNGSLGYQTGKQYTLNIHHAKGTNLLITRCNTTGRCEYESVISFLESWDNIIFVK